MNQLDQTFNTNAYNVLFAQSEAQRTQKDTLASNVNALLAQYGIDATNADRFASVFDATDLA